MKKAILAHFITAILLLSCFHTKSEQTTVFHIGNKKLIIQQGNIAQCYHFDAIVNAANEELLAGGGVCGAIFDAAGREKLQEACNKYPILHTEGYYHIRCPVGESRITDSFNLKKHGINYIIHTVGPDCRITKESTLQDQLLENAYKSALQCANQKNIYSLAFPFISTGIYQFPRDRAAKIAINTIVTYLKNEKTDLTEVHLVLFNSPDFYLVQKIAQQLLKS